MRSQKERLPRPLFRNPFHFIENSAGSDDRHPIFRSSLPFSHPRLRRFFGNRFIRKDADPDSAGPFYEPGHGNSGGFDLSGCQPPAFRSLEPKVTKIEHTSAKGLTPPSPFLLFTILSFLRHQHDTLSYREEWDDGALEYGFDKKHFGFFSHYFMIPIFHDSGKIFVLSRSFFSFFRRKDFSFKNPDLHTDDPVGRFGLSQTKIDICP